MPNATKYWLRDIDLPSKNIFRSSNALRCWKVKTGGTRRPRPQATCRSLRLFGRVIQTSHSADVQVISISDLDLPAVFRVNAQRNIRDDEQGTDRGELPMPPSRLQRIPVRVLRDLLAGGLKRQFPGSRPGSPRQVRRYRFPIPGHLWRR